MGVIGLIGDSIGGFFVALAAQGQGIDARLLVHAFARRDRLKLGVCTVNEAAFGFYLSQGSTEIGRAPTDSEGLPFAMARLTRAGKVTMARTGG